MPRASNDDTPLPPVVGERLPRGAEAFGVRDKLAGYSLDLTHRDGGAKAHGFERILGIEIADIGYLEGAIQTAVLVIPVSSVRENPPWGHICVVMVPVRGLGEKRGRVVAVRTVWEIAGEQHRPRLANAYCKP
ncbi:MAG TPA: hypothetical protein VK756_06370 [Solirubrobacteraceae bacterium]|jgi:hypothetical protein|nr:hypothetical protein [Solirubrobacteraceae bacterium]